MAFPETIARRLFHLGPVTISSTQLFILGTAVTLMAALWYFIEHTEMGRAIRATAENHETAALLGVDVDRVVIVTFMIGRASLASPASSTASRTAASRHSWGWAPRSRG